MEERVLIVVRVGHAEVVDVNTNDETFIALARRRGDLTTRIEDARVGFTLGEALSKQPGEQRTLPTTAGLGHAVHGLDHLTDHGVTVGVVPLVA